MIFLNIIPTFTIWDVAQIALSGSGISVYCIAITYITYDMQTKDTKITHGVRKINSLLNKNVS